MLRVIGLSKRFGDKTALDEVTVDVAEGSFVGVIGRSGAGKSTLLRVIDRLGEPTRGRVLWKGEDVTGYRGQRLAAWRSRCAMIFPQVNLIGRLDVLTNVLMGRLNHTPSWRAILGLWKLAD